MAGRSLPQPFIIPRASAPERLEKSLRHVLGKKDGTYVLSGYPGGGGKAVNLEDSHIHHSQVVYWNAPVPALVEASLTMEKGLSFLTDTGAVATVSGKKTGRSPQDKRVVDEPTSTGTVWWGSVNIKLSEDSFLANRERALDYLNCQEALFVVDAYAGWDPAYRIKIRVLCTRPYHALFMRNMLIVPPPAELATFEPDFVIYNAGSFPANRFIPGVTSEASVALHFGRNEMVILGTQYAGEMKKGVLTLMMHRMPERGVLPLHSSANVGADGTATVFFGLSGTGKTTLSADVRRALIGDDEHVWTDTGLFNIEGGCYAKCVDLSRESEPEIYDALRYGSILENVVMGGDDRKVDYRDISITENTRAAYPLEFIPNARIPAICGHPRAVVLLTCDAFGVLPPVSRLSAAQCMYQFISGYTAKVAGTEVGVKEPGATFSACFGGPFLVWHPTKYAEMLAEKLRAHGADAWLVNTGWTGGPYPVGKRISLRYTRAMVDAINDGSLRSATFTTFPAFGFEVPTAVAGVPAEVLTPVNTWPDKAAYTARLNQLVKMFNDNFAKYADKASPEVLAAAPKPVE